MQFNYHPVIGKGNYRNIKAKVSKTTALNSPSSSFEQRLQESSRRLEQTQTNDNTIKD